MKTFLIIAGIALGLYYLVFKSANGKTAVNAAALKLGLGTATKPLIA